MYDWTLTSELEKSLGSCMILWITQKNLLDTQECGLVQKDSIGKTKEGYLVYRAKLYKDEEDYWFAVILETNTGRQ